MLNQDTKRTFGKFHLLERIGVGGMASVYRATDTETNKTVAVKLLHEQYFNNAIMYRRFEREAYTIQQLSHPNIINIIEYGLYDKRPYLTMDYFSGGSLSQCFERMNGFETDKCLEILQQLADAIDYAHLSGVVHRDLKLDNVLLSGDGTPVITDFGLAHMPGMSRLTVTGKIIGTTAYIAPEVLLRGRDHVDFRADLYAFAVMTFVMLTGRFPFDSTDAISLLLQHLSESPAKATDYNPNLPGPVNDVLNRALSTDPDIRFQSATTFIRNLSHALTGQVVASKHASNVVQLSTFSDPMVSTKQDSKQLNLPKTLSLPQVVNQAAAKPQSAGERIVHFSQLQAKESNMQAELPHSSSQFVTEKNTQSGTRVFALIMLLAIAIVFMVATQLNIMPGLTTASSVELADNDIASSNSGRIEEQTQSDETSLPVQSSNTTVINSDGGSQTSQSQGSTGGSAPANNTEPQAPINQPAPTAVPETSNPVVVTIPDTQAIIPPVQINESQSTTPVQQVVQPVTNTVSETTQSAESNCVLVIGC